MAGLLKAGGYVLGFAALFYAAAILLALIVTPPETGALDTQSVFTDRTAYRLEERYLAQNVWSLGEKRDRVIILGASAATLTFRPPLLQPSLPGVEIDNLSIAGANNSMARKTLHLVYQAMPADWRGHTTFVLAVTYTNFVENRFAFKGLTDNLTQELRRFDLYRSEPDGIFDARLSPTLMGATALVVRPALVIAPYMRETLTDLVPGDLRVRLNLFLRRRGLSGDKLDGEMEQRLAALENQGDAASDAYVVAPEMMAWLVRITSNDIGGDHALPDEQFQELEKMAREIAAHGDRLVIVDMPLPSWHVQGLPRHAVSYREKMAATMGRLSAQPGVGYLDLRGFGDPDNFYDAVHPKPRVQLMLSAQLAQFLKDRAGSGPT